MLTVSLLALHARALASVSTPKLFRAGPQLADSVTVAAAFGAILLVGAITVLAPAVAAFAALVQLVAFILRGLVLLVIGAIVIGFLITARNAQSHQAPTTPPPPPPTVSHIHRLVTRAGI